MASSAFAWKIASTSPKTARRCSLNKALRLISPSAERRPKPVQDITGIYKTSSCGCGGLIMCDHAELIRNCARLNRVFIFIRQEPENVRRKLRKLSSLRNPCQGSKSDPTTLV